MSDAPTPSPAPGSRQTLDRRGLAALIGVSTRTLDRMRNDRGFPRPVTGRGRNPLWSAAAVRRWLDAE